MASLGEVPQASANFEIKARCADLDAARARAARIATRRVGIDHQVDTYFRVRAGRLKLRESSLSGGQLVPYLRPDLPGPKRADYRVVPVADAAGLKTLLAEILGVHRVVEKEREIFLVENVRIHLDRVKGLGTFLELEAVFDGSRGAEAEQRLAVERLMTELGVRDEDLVDGSYEGLIDG
jgi:predicted adenylyl cyclase CyaB